MGTSNTGGSGAPDCGHCLGYPHALSTILSGRYATKDDEGREKYGSGIALGNNPWRVRGRIFEYGAREREVLEGAAISYSPEVLPWLITVDGIKSSGKTSLIRKVMEILRTDHSIAATTFREKSAMSEERQKSIKNYTGRSSLDYANERLALREISTGRAEIYGFVPGSSLPTEDNAGSMRILERSIVTSLAKRYAAFLSMVSNEERAVTPQNMTEDFREAVGVISNTFLLPDLSFILITDPNVAYMRAIERASEDGEGRPIENNVNVRSMEKEGEAYKRVAHGMPTKDGRGAVLLKSDGKTICDLAEEMTGYIISSIRETNVIDPAEQG